MEQENKLDGQKSALKDILNEGIGRLVSDWQTPGQGRAIEASMIAGRLNAVINEAQKSGSGIEIRFYNRVVLGQGIPGITREIRKYIKQDQDNGNIVLKLEAKEERKEAHSRKIEMLFDAFRLHLVSSKATEGRFWKEDIKSIRVK